MKNTFTILVITLISLLNLGCASTSPDSYNGATKNYNANYFDNNDSIEFKYAFRYLMPTAERVKFEATLEASDYISDNWNKKMQSEGFNALTIGATGTDTLSSNGQAAGLALSLVDDYLTSQSEKEMFSYMVFSDDWLEGNFTDAISAHTVARKKTLNAIRKTALEFDYVVVCIAHCEESMATFELVSTNQDKYKGVFHPEKLSLILYLSELTKIEDDAIEKRVFSSDSNFQAKHWDINITGNEAGFSYKTILIPDGKNGIYKQESYEIATTDYTFNQTPIGRNFLRSLSAKMKNWIVVDVDTQYELAVINGQLYSPVNESSAKSFKGARTKE